MNRWLGLLACTLLLFNGIGAVYGGWNLVLHPDGSSIQLSIHWLEHTPFRDYRIPGIILFVVNGLLSFVVLVAVLLKWENYFQFIIAQGLILMGWIIIQMVLIQTIHFLHILLGSVSIILVVIGQLLKRIV